MSDFGTNEGKEKMAVKNFTGTPFFTFAKPYFDFISKGKMFTLAFIVMAAINLALPFAIFFKAIDYQIFDYGGRFAAGFIFS